MYESIEGGMVLVAVIILASIFALSLAAWDNWKSQQKIMQNEADYNAKKAKKIGQEMKKL